MTEKHITLPVSLKVRDILLENGYNVIMTRDSDIIPEGADTDNDGFYYRKTEDIARLVNEWGADYFFSIHCDSFPSDESVSGPRFYYYVNGAGTPYEWVNTITEGFTESTGLEAKIVEKTDDNAYNVLRFAESTAGLVELGFITNKEEAEKLITDEYQTRLAEGIANGIMKYIPIN
jgi:N-acetylmuramoyl-L-alanine amidase